MRAIAIHDFGGPERLELIDSPMPPVGEGEVLLAVRLAGVNPVDWRIRSGQFRDFLPCEFPLILGREACGVVAALGAGVDTLRPGQRVCGFLPRVPMRWGCYAQYVPARAAHLAPVPDALSDEQAAALPVAGYTAWQGLRTLGGLAPGETVLIHGAAGGVGHVAVQLARHLRARVLATASPANHDFVRAQGAHVVVDYRAPDFVGQLAAGAPEGVDLILAAYPGAALQACAPLLRAHSRVVMLSPDAGPADQRIGPAPSQLLIAQPDAAQLAQVLELGARGVLRAEIAGVLPLEQAARAHAQSAGGHTRGKLLLAVD